MSISRNILRRLLSTAAILVVLISSLGAATPAQAAPTELFFSEYIEGSSNNKALEIYNGTGAAIDLNAGGYNIQMYFNGSISAGTTINLTGTVANGDVYVVAHSSANATILAVADQTSGASWYNGDDAVVLRKGTTVIDVIGQIGFDPGTEWGAGLQSTADNTLRRMNSIEAGDTNGSDAFVPSAQWDGYATDTFSGLGFHCVGECAPFVVSTSPANNATNVPLNSNLTIKFSEPVDVSSGAFFTLSCDQYTWTSGSSSGFTTATLTIDPDQDFLANDRCTLTIHAAYVYDTDANDPPNNMSANYSFTFYTVLTDISIHTIQGASHTSPYNGKPAQTTGIVTAKLSSGFYMQEPAPDANEATSEGIFVYTGSSPAVTVGDNVRVSGWISEYRPGGASTYNLTTTEFTSPAITVLSSGNPLPAATIIGSGGRMPPTANIEDDSATGNVETSNTFDPASDGIDFYESLEGMRVQVNNPLVVGPTNGYGEIFLVPDLGAWAVTATPRGGLIYTYADGNPERIQIDDNIVSLPYANVGDRLSTIIGVLDYNFGNFEIYPVTTPTVTTGGLAREVTTPAGTTELAVAAFNVENLTAGDAQAKFDGLATLIVNNLQSPDILTIEEIQDNTGTTNDGTVAADQTWNKLIAAISAAGGPAYQYRQVDPANNSDGGATGGNIRVGFLFRTDRGLTFVDRPGATATTANAVLSDALGPYLQYSPGRIDPTNTAFDDSRKPLVGEFNFRGRRLFVIANHWNSKGGDTPLFGNLQPAVRSSEVQRLQQATVVAGFVQQILAADPDALIVAAGDLNDFEFSPAVGTLKAAPMHDLIETLPANERYTYVFEGNSQTLDHILISDFLFAQPFSYDVVHVNSEFFDQLSDHEPEVVRLNFTDLVMVATNGVTHLPFSGDGVIQNGETLTQRPAQIGIFFTQPVYDPPGDSDPDDVTNPANYSLIPTGIDHISYDPLRRLALLYLNGGQPLPPGNYTLVIKGTTSIVNASGVPLAGDGVNAGTDFVINFSVASLAMPATGFAPGVATALEAQPESLAYQDLGQVWLEIPAQGVRAPIVGVPPAENGEWNVSWLNNQIGWLQGTAFPGEAGNAVVTAHVYNADGQAGPFVGLRGLSYDDIVVLHAFGQRYTYAVRSSYITGPGDTRAITRQEDRAWLTLITCQGYNAETGAYQYRRVVRTVLVDVSADK